MQRYHFFDGLRGFAMLLGLILHAAMSFRGWGVWGVEEVSAAPKFFGWVFDAIHGFRMQLFFVVSGFFTMMLAKRRGLRALAKQRLLRIGVPLVVGTIILTPTIGGISSWGEERKKERFLSEEVKGAESWSLSEAVAVGDSVRVREFIEGGADLEIRGGNEETPLITAAFFGRAECVELLLEAGAELEVMDRHRTTPLKAATMDFSIVESIADTYGLEADEEGRKRCAELLIDAGSEGVVDDGDEEVSGLIWLLTFYPIFHHLWFLYYLLWLLLAFYLVIKMPWRVPDRFVISPLALGWLIPLTWCFQIMMPDQVGPGTATGMIPYWPKMGYYAVFFFFGVLCYGRELLEEKLGKKWPLLLILAMPCLWIAREWQWWAAMQIWAQLAAVCYAWLMIAVFFGVFRKFCNSGKRAFRYLSDASYWLYLAHLPLIIVVQILVGSWELTAWIKFPLTVVAVALPLLLIYEYAVRYTWVGAILNGRKYRVPPLPLDVSERE